MKKYFYCYSYPLKDFLLENEQESILHAIHPKTKRKYWVFVGSEQLNKLLDEWKNRKK